MGRGNVRASVVVTVTVVAVSSCGSPAPTHSASLSSSPTVSSRPSAAAGPCASVTTTTAIAQVPAACAAVWAPYGVTKVPPANLTDSTPVPADVVNGTHGSVTDSEAKAWALAANRTAMWDRWAEQYGQAALLPHLLKQGLVPASELNALSRGARIDQPDCSSFGTRYGLFPLGADGLTFFSGLGQLVTARYVLAITYPGPCQIVATYPDGHKETLFSFAGSGTTVFAGADEKDRVLGQLWFSEAAADCGSHGSPASWCSA